MKRHSIEEIIWIMRQIGSSGVSVSVACETYQITRMTYYRWLKKYRGIAPIRTPQEPPRANQFELENAQLKNLVVEQALNIHLLKQMISKNSRLLIEPGDRDSSAGFSRTQLDA